MKRCPLCGRILTRLRKDSNEIVIRGLCPEDRDRLIKFYEQLSDETIYTRFFSIIRYFDPYVDKLVSSSGILAIVAEEASSGEIVGVAELVLDKDGRAEGGIIVLERMQGKGIGTAMALSMKELAKEYGIRKVYGYILADNIKALRLVKKLGGRPKSYYSSMIYVEIPVEDG